jgi:predicted NAD/FAD-dependent oxidoreductase
MSALGRSLAQDVSVQTGVRVDRIERVGEALSLRGARAPSGVTLPASPQAPPGAAVDVELGSFDAVLISAPAPQAAALVAQLDPDLGARARAVAFEPCFALGFAVSRAPGEEQQRAALEQLPFDGAFIGRPHAASDAPSDSPLAWVARDGSKPGRASRASSGADHERWVLHASGAWSRSFFDASEAEVTRAMLDAFAALFGLPTLEPALSVLRRWTLARATTPLAGALFNADRSVGLGGDWALGGRVEGAYLSGLALAEGLRRT